MCCGFGINRSLSTCVCVRESECVGERNKETDKEGEGWWSVCDGKLWFERVPNDWG